MPQEKTLFKIRRGFLVSLRKLRLRFCCSWSSGGCPRSSGCFGRRITDHHLLNNYIVFGAELFVVARQTQLEFCERQTFVNWFLSIQGCVADNCASQTFRLLCRNCRNFGAGFIFRSFNVSQRQFQLSLRF